MCIPVNLYKEPYDVYIGRAKKGEPYNIWCNPNPLANTKDDTEREANLAKYKTHLWNEIKAGRITRQMLIDLDGKRLGCFCKPKLCHGDVIAKAVRWALNER